MRSAASSIFCRKFNSATPFFFAKAFTLIEVLAVIAVVGILVALLLPVLGKMRERAAEAKCMSNLRQIGAAMNLFASDNDGYYPFWGGAKNPDSDGPWYGALTKDEAYGLEKFKAPAWTYDRVFYCPLSGKDGSGGWPAHNPDYGINLEVTDYQSTRTKAIMVTHPSATVLMVETGGVKSPFTGEKTIYAGDFRFAPPWNSLLQSGPMANGLALTSQGMVFRHPRPAAETDMSASSCHALFCDGHVEAISFNDPRLQTREARDRLFLPDK